MRWSAFVLLLLEGKMFFPSIALLKKNDPWEGYFKIPDSFGHAIGNRRKELKLQKWLKDKEQNPFGDTTEVFFRELAKRRAVSCWHRSLGESALMWQTYADAGVAIQTTLRKLMNFLPHDRQFLISRIQYLPTAEGAAAQWFRRPEHDKLVLRPYLIKGIEYHSEQEVRIVTPLNAGYSGAMIRGTARKGLIDRIVISPRINRCEQDALCKLIRSLLKNTANSPLLEIACSTGPVAISPLEQEQKALADGPQVKPSILSGPPAFEEDETFAQRLHEAVPNHQGDQVPWPLDTL